MCVKQTRLTELTRRAPTPALQLEPDSRKDRWHPSPQLMRVLEPSGDIMRREGLESREAVVRMRIEAVIAVVSNVVVVARGGR